MTLLLQPHQQHACASLMQTFMRCLLHTAGVYVHSIATGDGTMADVSSTFFGNVNDQVWAVTCGLH